MIEPGSRTAVALGGARTWSRHISGLRSAVAGGSVVMAQVGILGVALVIQTIVNQAPGHFRPAPNVFLGTLCALGTLTALVLVVVAALPAVRHTALSVRRSLGVIALASLTGLSILGVYNAGLSVRAIVLAHPYGNDGAVLDLYGAHQILHGRNPYLKTNIAKALAALNAPATTTTPLMAGQFLGARAYPSPTEIQRVFDNALIYRPHTIPPEFESKYDYPAGSILFILPFVALGLSDMRFLYALALILMGVYLWRRLPERVRLVAPLFLLANVPLMMLQASGQPDPLYGLPLLIGYAEWRRSRVSPLAMGVAAGTKQLAWFFLPFYFILIWRRFGWREALRRAGIITGIFLLMNGPFILWSPGAYFDSIATPMVEPMFPLGVGLIAIFVVHGLPTVPKVMFTLLEGASWVGGWVTTACARYLTPAVGVALAALPLFFAWRSLVSYFYLIPILALGVILTENRHALERRR